MGKFIKLYEKVYERFEKTSGIPGDYVKLRSDIKSSDFYKSLDEPQSSRIDEILELQKSGKFVILRAIKGNTWDTHQISPTEYTMDISIVEAPGLYTHDISVPSEVVEFHMSYADHRATAYDKNLEQDNKEIHDPQKVDHEDEEFGTPTKHKGGDYKLANESSTTTKYLSDNIF